ncbi:MAG: hypothetical protein EBR02_08040 [Alphaproteobacteria bacterium]|nr:hypothetical protein [Alphaproteobacteria bacterium]
MAAEAAVATASAEVGAKLEENAQAQQPQQFKAAAVDAGAPVQTQQVGSGQSGQGVGGGRNT